MPKRKTISSKTSKTPKTPKTSKTPKTKKNKIEKKSLRLMSFGIELQASSSIMLYSEIDHDETILYFPNYFRKIKISDNPRIDFYGDATTDRTLYKDMLKLHEQYPHDKYDVQILYEDKSYCLLDTRDKTVNDLEINITYPNLYNVNDITHFLLNKVMDSFKRVDDLLNRGHLKTIDSFNYNQIDGRKFKEIPIKSLSKFQWHDLIIPTPIEKDPIHILSKGRERPEYFYVQITVGVMFDHLLDTFDYFKNEYNKIPIDYRKSREDYYMDIIDDIKAELIYKKSDSVLKNKKLFTIYVLYKYIISTRNNPKKYPFIIRHHLTSIVQLLTNSEFNYFLTWLSIFEQDEIRDLRNTKHYQAIDRFHTERKSEIEFLYDIEKCQGKSALYPLLNQKLIFLIEVRYYNNILNNYLGQNNQLLSYQDLKNIPFIQSYTRSSIPIHKQIYPDVPSLLPSLFSDL
jgi:hypothetical protein